MADNQNSARDPTTKLRDQLSKIFFDHPECTTIQTHDGSQEPLIPARAISHILTSFSNEHGVALLNTDEVVSLEQTTSSMDGDVTIDVLLGFITMAAEANLSQPTSSTGPPLEFPSSAEPAPSPALVADAERGRGVERDPHEGGHSSRASSSDSVVTSFYRPEDALRNPLRRVPSTPAAFKSSDHHSRFDSDSRQRTQPLQNAPPSAFSRRPQPLARRRKSDGGTSYSDSESSTSPLADFRRRGRAPSNPSSPGDGSLTSSHLQLLLSPSSSEMLSPDSSFGDEHSFSGSWGGSRPSPPRNLVDRHPGDDSIDIVNNILGQPQQSFDDKDDDGSESGHSSFRDAIVRSTASSLASLASPDERLEVLQRANADLNKKLQERESFFMSRFTELEQVIEDLQARLEQLKTELAIAKKEEKELRQKEGRTTIQLNTFESEISKLQRSLEASRTSHQNLQKQYSEQCLESERYRNSLRNKDATIKDLEDHANHQSSELGKARIEKEVLESTIVSYESELETSRLAQHELEEQKRENLFLKETIDRLRFDLDELRTANANTAAAIGVSSNAGSMTRSLANELKSRLDAQDADNEDREEDDSLESLGSTTSTLQDEDDTEYVETIITAQRRRKVGPRANTSPSIRVHKTKEYADAYTQHNHVEFTSNASAQTDPVLLAKTSGTQTDNLPATSSVSTQSQTDNPQPVAGPSSTFSLESSNHETCSAASSLSLLPDSPPSYENVTGDERLKIVQKWHPGYAATSGINGGVSATALREWANVKKELGFECLAIEKALASSQVNGERADQNGGVGEAAGGDWVQTSDEDSEVSTAETTRPRRKFYNIYNTYFLGGQPGADGQQQPPLVSLKDLAWLGLGLSIAFMATNVLESRDRYEDRTYWAAFNTLGAPSGAYGLGDEPSYDAIWVVLEKIVKSSLAVARRAPGNVMT